MPLTRTYTDIPNLKINKFPSKEAFDLAVAQELIGENELSLVENDFTQSDWNQDDNSKDDYIKNKPTTSYVTFREWTNI